MMRNILPLPGGERRIVVDKYQQDQDEAQIRALILREWSRERIVRFAAHLMGDECQECTICGEPVIRPDITRGNS